MINSKEFWSRVDVKDKHECWEWQGVVQSQARPYGYFRTGNSRVKSVRHYAHKHALRLADPNVSQLGMDVRHRCDNPRCCNPYHLIVGTRSENVRDYFQRKK